MRVLLHDEPVHVGFVRREGFPYGGHWIYRLCLVMYIVEILPFGVVIEMSLAFLILERVSPGLSYFSFFSSYLIFLFGCFQSRY